MYLQFFHVNFFLVIVIYIYILLYIFCYIYIYIYVCIAYLYNVFLLLFSRWTKTSVQFSACCCPAQKPNCSHPREWVFWTALRFAPWGRCVQNSFFLTRGVKIIYYFLSVLPTLNSFPWGMVAFLAMYPVIRNISYNSFSWSFNLIENILLFIFLKWSLSLKKKKKKLIDKVDELVTSRMKSG